MNDDDKALVKQLRASECIAYYDDEPGMVADEELLDEAAGRIEALSEENERLREALMDIANGAVSLPKWAEAMARATLGEAK